MTLKTQWLRVRETYSNCSWLRVRQSRTHALKFDFPVLTKTDVPRKSTIKIFKGGGGGEGAGVVNGLRVIVKDV